MSNNKVLHSVWDESIKFIANSNVELEALKLNALLSSVFCAGPFYFYVIDFSDRKIKYMHESIYDILGVDPKATTFDDIINLIHPEDIGFVASAEKHALEFIYGKLGPEKAMSYKASYCFRMKTRDDSYKLFQHQALAITVDENWCFSQALNVHTDISHLTNENNYCISIIGLNQEPSFFNINVPGYSKQIVDDNEANVRNTLSSRELEVIKLIAQGNTNELIAQQLCLSIFTIKNHRKNIFKKMKVKNSNELVSFCITKGII